MHRRNWLVILLVAGLVQTGPAQMSGPETTSSGPGGYLFAHMTKQDYGRLYYSVSTDGLHWTLLNEGKRIIGEQYRGHPDIAKGHDGRYYLLGNYEHNREINIWVSADLVSWSKFGSLKPDLWKTPNFTPALHYIGAPKIFFDEPSSQYVITWHSTQEKPIKEDTEQFWRGMRTLYITSKDLVTFSDPKRLFGFDMATIDVILRRDRERYYAIIKDELYPSFAWPTGKTIRVCSAPKLLGPYNKPSPPISPNFREAPTLIPRPDGQAWFLYFEQYPGVSYGLSTAPRLDGPWYDVYCEKYAVPAEARHGCMIPISRRQYNAITAAYGKKPLP